MREELEEEREKEYCIQVIKFFPLHSFISSCYLFNLYYVAFLTIFPNLLFGFIVCFGWFEGFSFILQVDGGFILGFTSKYMGFPYLLKDTSFF